MNVHSQNDSYSIGIANYDNLDSQVNNIVSGKSPKSFNFSKLLKNPWVYLGTIFLIFLIILWVWSPSFLHNDNGKIKIWLILLITSILSLLITGLLWFFWLRKLN